MKTNHILAAIVSTLLMWVVCFLFNSTATVGKVVLDVAFINPADTFLHVRQYMTAGFGMASWAGATLAVALLLFIWGALYYFIYCVKAAIDTKPHRK